MDSIKFLKKWSVSGPWVLTAIGVDRKYIETRSFTPETEEEAVSWINKHNGEKNIYFHVNTVMRQLSKKAEREDIATVDWLHIDIDPKLGKDFEEEQQKALQLLKNPPNSIPPPTVIIFSGGGYQGFWKLEDPIQVYGDINKAEDAKRYNIQLETLFEADNCHNIDRIMRLPGTYNIPDAKKRKKGRTKALAKLIEFNNNVYPLSVFKPAPLVQTNNELGFGGSSIKISTNVPRLESVEDLGEEVSDWVKVLIVQGKDPNEPYKYPSRSECLFAVCCELVRAGIDNGTIFSVITDPDFMISKSVLDKGTMAERYAARQIERAQEEAINPWLRKLNEKHAVVADIGGKCRVISETKTEIFGRTRISKQSFEDFRNRYMHIQVVVGKNKDGEDVYMRLGRWWLEHRQRRQYDTIVFSPGHTPDGAYNLWRGFSYVQKPGDCSLYLEHIKQNICGGCEEYYEYLIKWMARAVQYPDRPGEVAIVLRGKRGTGKSSFVKHFGSLWGRHFLQVGDSKHLVGNFNAHLRDCVILFGDEAFYAGDKRHESILKMLVTEETIMYEPKGVDSEPGPNYTHLLLASNNDWVVPAGSDERRYFVLDVADYQIQKTAYFRAIKNQLNNGGYEGLLHYLMTLDISEYNVRKVPQTAALLDQKILSFTPEESWWYDILKEGIVVGVHSNWSEEVLKEGLYQHFIQYLRDTNTRYRITQSAFGKFIKRVMPDDWPKRLQKSNITQEEWTSITGSRKRPPARPHYLKFAELGVCRSYFDEHFGGPYDWNTENIEQIEMQYPSEVF